MLIRWCGRSNTRSVKMAKIGILTFHYSNNYGAVLQALSLQRAIELLGYDVEVINFIPSKYRPTNFINNLGLRKNIFKNKLKNLDIIKIFKKFSIMKKYGNDITNKFDSYRSNEMQLSKKVDENSLNTILNNYDIIVVGSDQVWNPSQRTRIEYFLNFGDTFQGKKISYAADSTIKEIDSRDMDSLRRALNDFSFISVRNEHSNSFVKAITDKDVHVVADPTIIYDLQNISNRDIKEDYILTYILGEEIKGSHDKALEKIKREYGNLPVYSIKIPTMNFELSNYADKVFYDLGPIEWLNLVKNANFIYTDSYHGVLFSLKYHRPFLAYYTERMRATRLVDIGKRYGIEKHIVQSVEEIESMRSIEIKPDYKIIDDLIEKHKQYSLNFLIEALRD